MVNSATEDEVHPSKLHPESTGLSPSREPLEKPTRSVSPSPGNRIRSRSPFRSLSPFGHHLDDGSHSRNQKPNVLVCHQSARAIVFRDHLRLARKIIQEEDELESELESGNESEDNESDAVLAEAAFQNMRSTRQSPKASIRDSSRTNTSNKESASIVHEINELARSLVPEFKNTQFELSQVSERNMEIEGLHAHITPLEELEYTSTSEFDAVLESKEPASDWTTAEVEVFEMLQHQKACVKTIKNSEWPSFLKRFLAPKPQHVFRHAPSQHDDIGPRSGFPFNSFVTSTSLLPEGGKKMRCYGSNHAYTVGVVFALPDMDEAFEEEAQNETETWSWPAGYAAKTEFNISHGKLINGRQEALVSLKQLRQYNDDYLHKQDHFIAGRMIKGGFSVVPYNEVFLRVGGRSRIVQNKDILTGEDRLDREGTGRSFETGVGLFCALFIRSFTMGDIIALFRTRARISYYLGESHLRSIPLLYIDHENGVRVITESLQLRFWKLASHKLQPFKDPILASTLSCHETNETSLQTKLEGLIELPVNIQKALSHKECARIAGGFGVTDSIISDLLFANQGDFKHLQEIMGEGLAFAIRSGDHYNARQLLILYMLQTKITQQAESINQLKDTATLYTDTSLLKQNNKSMDSLPPPIDTKRLRRATNLDGLLIVLGAAQILKTISTGRAKCRTEESIEAVEEWVHHGEDSVAFRLSSWRQQKTDEADSKIAMSKEAKMMAFVTNKSVHNRKQFAEHLREAIDTTDFSCVRFLQVVYNILEHMHSPCMRLEILQFILGLDNRYSVTLIKESVELAATCLSILSD